VASATLMTARGAPRVCPPHALGVDCLTPLSDLQLASLAARGVAWIGAYVQALREDPSYLDRIFAHQLAVAPIAEGLQGALTAEMGDAYGGQVVSMLQGLFCPGGVHVTIDLEDDQGDAAGCVNAHARRQLEAGLRAMLYVGQPCTLTGAELQALLPDRYWRSGSLGVGVPRRQWCVLQLRPIDQVDGPTGAALDWDIVEADAEGELPVFWWPS
jgi:hypothetical protein